MAERDVENGPRMDPGTVKELQGLERAFSLLELLAVVVMVSVVVAFLVPIGFRQLEQANMVKCLSQMRAIGQATLSYAADNGSLPALDAKPGDSAHLFGTAGNDRLMMAVYPYIENRSAFQCPAINNNKRSFFQNGSYFSTYNQNAYTFAARIGAIASPTETILIYEGLPMLNITGNPPLHQINAFPISSTIPFHSSKIPTRSQNVLMADGHAKSGLCYLGWENPGNTLPADGGIWGGNRYLFNK